MRFHVLEAAGSRLASAWRDAAAAAIAAGIAWIVAVWLFGHPRPIFAAVSAIVCLSPGLPSHGRQAVGLMLGVATGIVVGELVLLLPDAQILPEGASILRLVLASFLSVVVAASYGQVAVVPIQAGVSAILVLALGPESAGLSRLEDVAIGVLVGLVFSQVLLTPDPVRQMDAAAKELLLRLADAFNKAADALEAKDGEKAEAALRQFSITHDSLIALGSGIDAARYAARWSLRGRLVAGAVTETAMRYDRRAIRLYASSLLFGEALANAMRKDEEDIPPALGAAIRNSALRCACLADAKQIPEDAALPPSPAIEVAPGWHGVVLHLQAVDDALASLEAIGEAPSVAPPHAA